MWDVEPSPDLDSFRWAGERVHLVQDTRIGLQAIIAIHSTALGPALGGLRIRRYDHGIWGGLVDALRLSRAMTLKAAAAGLDLGGGKAVIVDDGRGSERAVRLAAVAHEIDRLNGAYITAEDIGTTLTDMDFIAERTPYVVGRTATGGVGGDPSPYTARSVVDAIRAGLQTLDNDDDVRGRTVGIIGLGKVGARVAQSLANAGARVYAYDPAVERSVQPQGVVHVTCVDDLLHQELDVVCPCAVGGTIDEKVARELRCRIVCGAANNPLSSESTAAILAARDILYVPDFLANCGGLIHADAERRGEVNPRFVDRALDEAHERTRDVLREAQGTGRLPSEVAEERAAARIRQARSVPRPDPGRRG